MSTLYHPIISIQSVAPSTDISNMYIIIHNWLLILLWKTHIMQVAELQRKI
uniref:Uncharacterized protein n=1 Tax=Oryza brachyantha TaxID=4533 RepID=J3NCX5_ORYBR